MQWKYILAGVAVAMALAPAPGWADAVGLVENARAKERQGRWLNHEDREQLRKWGGNDNRRYYSYGPYDDYGYYGDHYDHGPVYYYRTYPY